MRGPDNAHHGDGAGGEDAGGRFTAPPSPRSPWQLLYGAAHRARRAWHRGRAARLPRPVVSIGNLHWGGGGKTPLAAAVAAHLRDAGHRVCILSRGYGAPQGGGGVRVVSDGGAPLLPPAVAGDEPVLLAGELPGVAVVVAAERAAAGRHALLHLPAPPDVFVLDDGFSHLRLARDVDLLAFPAADPFAGGGRFVVPGRLPPAGRLREPLASVRHADAVVLTGLASEEVAWHGRGAGEGGAAAGEREAAALAAGLHRHGFRGAAFASALESGPLRVAGADGAAPPPGRRALLVAAIARPQGFLAAARRAAAEAGLEVAGELTFRDHHGYPAESLRGIADAAAAAGADLVLTTSKDRVKLAGRLHLPLAELPVAARPEAALWPWLDGRLALAAGTLVEAAADGRFAGWPRETWPRPGFWGAGDAGAGDGGSGDGDAATGKASSGGGTAGDGGEPGRGEPGRGEAG